MDRTERPIEEEATFQSADGLAIAYRSWRAAGRPRGVVVIVPGFNAHSGYYGWVAQQLVAGGLAVEAVDLPGRGNSGGEPFYVETFEDYVRDIEAVTAVIETREPGQPLFMLGHSAGGVAACLYALEHQADLA